MKKLKRLKSDKAYRDAYVASQINVGIPFQIRALRKQREWDQQTLADRAGMAQPRISALESPGYAQYSLTTLLRLASSFDVGLIVRFAPFSELVRWEDDFRPDEFVVKSIADEPEESFSRECVS